MAHGSGSRAGRQLARGSGGATQSVPANPQQYVSVLDISPVELARQITIYEHRLLSNIQAKEFMDQAWLGPDKEKLAPNIAKITDWSTRMSHWAATEILSGETPKARAAIYEHIVAIIKVRGVPPTLAVRSCGAKANPVAATIACARCAAQALEALQNFNGVVELLTGLQSSQIFRLRFTLQARPPPLLTGRTAVTVLAKHARFRLVGHEGRGVQNVSVKVRRQVDELMKETSTDLNYKRLRARIASSKRPLIPFPGACPGEYAVCRQGSASLTVAAQRLSMARTTRHVPARHRVPGPGHADLLGLGPNHAQLPKAPEEGQLHPRVPGTPCPGWGDGGSGPLCRWRHRADAQSSALRLAGGLAPCQSFKEVGYALAPLPEVLDYLQKTYVEMNDDERYSMSLQCEPRSSGRSNSSASSR